VQEGGTPKEFLHPFAFGGTRPTGDNKADRRVEIQILSNADVDSSIREGSKLWGEIQETEDFELLTADPTFVKMHGGATAMELPKYKPYGCTCGPSARLAATASSASAAATTTDGTVFTTTTTTTTTYTTSTVTSEGGEVTETSTSSSEKTMSRHDQLMHIQAEVEKRCGATCPDVYLDVENKRIMLKSELNFKGGKATLMPDSEALMQQITTMIDCLYECLKEEGWAMFHLQFDGHVHPTGQENRCLVISYFRAAEVILRVQEGGTPKEFLHPFSFGGTRPTGDNAKDRRVELHILTEDVAAAEAKGVGLWEEIKVLPEFTSLTEDPSFVKHHGGEGTMIDMTLYEPYTTGKASTVTEI